MVITLKRISKFQLLYVIVNTSSGEFTFKYFQVGCALREVVETNANLLEGYNFKFQSIPTDKVLRKMSHRYF